MNNDVTGAKPRKSQHRYPVTPQGVARIVVLGILTFENGTQVDENWSYEIRQGHKCVIREHWFLRRHHANIEALRSAERRKL